MRLVLFIPSSAYLSRPSFRFSSRFRFSFPRLVLRLVSYRLVSSHRPVLRLVSYLSGIVGCSWRCVVPCLAVLLGLSRRGGGRSLLRLSRGGAWCLASSFASVVHAPVSSIVSSAVSFSDVLRAGWRGVLDRLIVLLRLVGRGFPCSSSSSSCPSRLAVLLLVGRLVPAVVPAWLLAAAGVGVPFRAALRASVSPGGASFPSRHGVSFIRLVGRGGEVLASRFVLAGADGRWFSSYCFVACARLSSLPAGDVAMPCSSSVHRRFRLLLVIIWIRGMGPCGRPRSGSLSPASRYPALVSYRLPR